MSSDLAIANIHPGVWRAHQLASDTSVRIPSGFAALDQQLPGGGWPTRNLIELLLKHHGIGELRFLMPVLRKLSLEQKKLVLIGAPLLPLTPVFEQFGVALNQVHLIQTDKPQDRLWAIEQVLQSDSFGALFMWLPEEKALCNPTVLRRLQYQATRSQGLSFVFRPIRAQMQPSPASLRLCLTAQSPNSLRVHLIKRRGPVLEEPVLIDLPKPQGALPDTPHSQELVRALDRSELQTNLPKAQQATGSRIAI
ncbi:translesion DNA synthesis-associated protein ImuA [Limnobacter alexandrii]|uniref:translesion DNA synthesis-associated protein ImuA n=1 Tax=Limnobacter alexandrii TaxID=2570352 RepID=UPI001485F4AD|nr:translesion DNA synthesis-associated protein ImuA [Limnobacter alexandrii]